MNLDSLSVGEIRELRSYPLDVMGPRYAFRILEIHIDAVLDDIESDPAYSELIETLGGLTRCVNDGNDCIDQYLERDADEGGENVMDSETYGDNLREIAESIAECLEEAPEPVLDGILLEADEDLFEDQFAKIWDGIAETATKARGILLGHDSLPNELLFTPRNTSDWQSASQDLEWGSCALERSLAIAMADWPDPNQRCAVVTVALALIVCPGAVKVAPTIDDAEVWACFENIEVRLGPSADPTSLRWSRLVSILDEAGRPKLIVFKNLAELYDDHARNAKCLSDVKRHFPLAIGEIPKAAALGLAWATLQRFNVTRTSVFDVSNPENNGTYVECSELQLGIRLNLAEQGEQERIIGCWFPGL